jgi:putative ribosome biogenesis GTPase RsgA
VLLGSSGAGKSTIANALLFGARENLPTSAFQN